MQENMDENNSEYGHFSRTVDHYLGIKFNRRKNVLLGDVWRILQFIGMHDRSKQLGTNQYRYS